MTSATTTPPSLRHRATRSEPAGVPSSSPDHDGLSIPSIVALTPPSMRMSVPVR
jgi:hypothetical protein